MFPYCFRQEFVSDQCPDLTREVYLQDIHCVGSLCKLYFRELPNPLLTYELYKKFTVRPFAVLIPLSSSVDVLQVPLWQLFGIHSNLLVSGAAICINTSQCSSLLVLHWLSFPALVSFPHFMFISLSFSAVSSPSSCSFFHCVASLLLLFLPTVHLLPELLMLALFLITVHHWKSSGSPGACDRNHKGAVSSSLSLWQSLTPAQTDCSAHV